MKQRSLINPVINAIENGNAKMTTSPNPLDGFEINGKMTQGI